MGVSPDVEKYLCEKCSGKVMSGEVEMIPPPQDGIPEYKYYLSLEHGTYHVAVGDAVYMTPSDPHLGLYPYRIERLWKDPRFVIHLFPTYFNSVGLHGVLAGYPGPGKLQKKRQM